MPRYIDENEIYLATDGGKDIFTHYFPGYDFGNPKAFVKERTEEKTPSARITRYKGLWRITDYGNQDQINGMPGIAYVMYKENLRYYEALLFVESDILKRSIDGKKFVKPQWRAGYSFREMLPDDKKGTYQFTYKEHPTAKDLQAIGPFVTEDLLDKYNCKVVSSYEYCAHSKKMNRDVVHIFTATDDYPIFVFDYGDFKKLYKPHDLEKKNRFSYVGNKPAGYVYGWKQLLGKACEFVDSETGQEFAPSEKPSATVKDLYRCSGESDALNMASIGCHVYWLNSESADYGGYFRMIDDFCENHYQVLDLDKTGQEMATKIALKYINILNITLPEWLASKKDFRGNPCKDIKDFIAQHKTSEEAASALRMRKSKARRVKFWIKNTDKNTYSIDMAYFYYFLNISGFHLFEYPYLKGVDYCYAKETNNIVEIIAPDKIKRIVKKYTADFIENQNMPDERHVLNKLYGSNQVSSDTLDMLEKKTFEFRSCNENTEFLHFQNCSLRITPELIEKIPHKEVPNNILKAFPGNKSGILSHIINFSLGANPGCSAIEVNYTDSYKELLEKYNKSTDEGEKRAISVQINEVADRDKYCVNIHDNSFIFTSFLRNITRIHWRKELEEGEILTEKERKEEMLSLANIMYCLGYLSAQYKNQGKPWVVFLMDMKISEIGKSSGRSGKSLVSKALTFVRNSFYVGGRELNKEAKYQFLYDGYTEFHDIIEIDDMSDHADFDFFYTQITGNRTINAKNNTPFTLEYRKSGKMIFSTNFELPKTDNSTMSRILLSGVSDYYHESTVYDDYLETRSPLSEFGRELYTTFSDEEWNKFYYFMAYCIQLQMRVEKIIPPSENLQKRQMRKIMSSGLGQAENFLYWADDFFQRWTEDESLRPEETGSTCNIDHSTIYLDTLFAKEDALLHFIENSGLSQQYKNKFSSNSFKTRLRAWCEYKGYVLNPEEVITDTKNNRIIRKVKGKAVECLYIQTPNTAIKNEKINKSDSLKDVEQLLF